MTIARWACALALALSATAAAAKQPRPLFAAETPLHLVLRGPIPGLVRAKEPLDATLSVVGDAAETVPVKISARGITRRRTDVCPFPPIRVDFADPPEASLFAGEKRLKLVTHCQGDAGFNQFQLLELAAYRIYALLSPVSFRTRLATVDYVDRNGRPIATRWGFFIEDAKDVGKRNGLTRFKAATRVPVAELNPREAARVSLFEDLIGNLDWAITAGPAGTTCCHNSKLLGSPDSAANLVPVPYDFDESGIVDPPYAAPPAGVGVDDIRTRRYRGYCRTNAEAQAVAAELTQQRGAIIGVLDGIPGLEAKPRAKAAAYLAAFFDQIATPDGLNRLLATCLH